MFLHTTRSYLLQTQSSFVACPVYLGASTSFILEENYGKSRVLTSGEACGQVFVPQAMPNSPRDYIDLYSDLKEKQTMWPVAVVFVDPDTAAAPSNWVDSGLE